MFKDIMVMEKYISFFFFLFFFSFFSFYSFFLKVEEVLLLISNSMIEIRSDTFALISAKFLNEVSSVIQLTVFLFSSLPPLPHS